MDGLRIGPSRAVMLACVAALLALSPAARRLQAQSVAGGHSPAADRSQPPPGGASVPATAAGTEQTATVAGVVADTSGAAISTAQVTLQEVESNATQATQCDAHGVFHFASVPQGRYVVRVSAPGFSPWKIKDVLVVHEGEDVALPEVELGVESISTTVNAVSIEVLAEQQITAEEHQRILGVLPNFFVSYVPDPAPLTAKQKFKLAAVVSRDPMTFFTTGVSAGIEQWQGDFAGYGQGFSGYAERYGAAYGDKLSATFLGAALLPSLLHQDPRYFYRGHGPIIVRALYAISTVAVCKGDNGHWQPNYSNVLGNLGSAGISTLYYPSSDQHSVQVTVTNTLIGVAEGAIGTLFQEFLLRHLTHGTPPAQP